jgi:hypothetical protein
VVSYRFEYQQIGLDHAELNQTQFSSIIARTDIGQSWPKPKEGAVAQLGERMNGIHEVRGSIPLGSTNSNRTKSSQTQSEPSAFHRKLCHLCANYHLE